MNRRLDKTIICSGCRTRAIPTCDLTKESDLNDLTEKHLCLKRVLEGSRVSFAVAFKSVNIDVNRSVQHYFDSFFSLSNTFIIFNKVVCLLAK